ncbi:MAG: hypothetical protein AAB368_08235 [bacterium]
MKTTSRIGRVRRAMTTGAVAAGLMLGGVNRNPAGATPSTTYWTPCVIDIQGYRVLHLTYDNYTTLRRGGPASGGSAFANDLGLTMGVLPFGKFQMEVGFDYLEPLDDPWLFNAKLGAPEGTLFAGAPALETGIFNVGTRKGVTDLNVVHVTTGSTLPAGLGRLHLGAYAGNPKTLVSSAGKKANTGVMAGYDLAVVSAQDADGGFGRVVAADFMSGRNALGGGGAGLYYYFTRNVDVLAGPVWFNDPGINGTWKWTTQVDANF